MSDEPTAGEIGKPKADEIVAAAEEALQETIELYAKLRPMLDELLGGMRHQADQGGPITPAMLRQLQAIRDAVG